MIHSDNVNYGVFSVSGTDPRGGEAMVPQMAMFPIENSSVKKLFGRKR